MHDRGLCRVSHVDDAIEFSQAIAERGVVDGADRTQLTDQRMKLLVDRWRCWLLRHATSQPSTTDKNAERDAPWVSGCGRPPWSVDELAAQLIHREQPRNH